MIPAFKARRINGKRLLDFQFEGRFKQYLMSFREGTILDVFVRRASKARTLPQNRYYWGVVVAMLSDFIGEEPEAMHEALKFKFLSYTDRTSGLTISRSTTELSTVEFKKYCEAIQRWAMEFLEMAIPDPNQCIDFSDNEWTP